MLMNKLNLQTAQALIDFSGKGAVSIDMAQQQLQGTVALHNMLVEHNLAYLADEVGMGKTYIGLGVVALMRRFQPALRVLYLLPKNNVRDKWLKDYRSFIDKNYKLHDGIVKGFGKGSAAPYRLCGSFSDLIQAVATDSARDYFICTSAFSLSLGKTYNELMTALNRFRKELPQNASKVDDLIRQLEGIADGSDLSQFKSQVKHTWADALNSILPTFDLIVVDEAHNYRHGMESSDRNQLLAAALGTKENSTSRVKRVLLLSATPYDRDIGQLQRQLKLFCKDTKFSVPTNANVDQLREVITPFMVRRLNSLKLGDRQHTRNMYRTEHRFGPEAEIKLGIKQQLFAALLQKKVSESLNENNSGKFELGMLASFESYLPSNKGQPVTFDGGDEKDNATDGRDRDAPDRNVVELLVTDFQERFGEFPPHPKMDEVAKRAGELAFQCNKKQLIFVRRVGSVGELKAKIEDNYNSWICKYVENDPEVVKCYDEYTKLIGERRHTQLDDEQDTDKANVSSFFAWFYRGNNELLVKYSNKLLTTPFNFRNLLASASIMFDTNWSTLPGMPKPSELNLTSLKNLPSLPANPTRAQQFERAQYAYLHVVASGAEPKQARVAKLILTLAFKEVKAHSDNVETNGLAEIMSQETLWESLRSEPILNGLSLKWTSETFELLAGEDEIAAASFIRKVLIHHRLTAAVCRLDHPFIDLYSLRRDRERGGEKTADQNLTLAFVKLLLEQSTHQNTFSSYVVLRDLTSNLDLILKQNFEDVYDKSVAELTMYLTRQLQPLSPILGATGANSASRSAIARKFRMPGYPRVLVSTDVFQEGEDLHTFCDSVTHFGISASPISLEQKVGRVDRIASMSHRAMNGEQCNYKEHFIQVNFPHIRESLEFLQIRQAARNLNQFILSMNRIGEPPIQVKTEVELGQQLLNISPIEAQISDFLESPFAILEPTLDGMDRNEELMLAQESLNKRRAHVQSLVEKFLSKQTGSDVSLKQYDDKLEWEGPEGLIATFHGAHGRADLLLSISQPSDSTLDTVLAVSPEAVHYLSELQADPLVRLQRVVENDNPLTYSLRRNAEIYAGGRDVLSDGEVTDLYQRVTNTTTPNSETTQQISYLASMVATLCGDHGSYNITQCEGNEIIYHFVSEERQQRLKWRLSGNYVLLIAQVLSIEQTKELANHTGQLLLHTLSRNAIFDLVDFHISADHALAVRAIHPFENLSKEELTFAASMVAVEANRLRQIMVTTPTDENEEATIYIRPNNSLRLWAEENDVMCIIRSLLTTGPMTQENLIKQTAYGLGYLRASSNISTALEGVLLAAARRGITERKLGMIHLMAHSITDYEDAHLKEQFLAAMNRQGSGLIEREQAIRLFSRRMGFARTGPIITNIGTSLIRKLLRSGRLQATGTRIRYCRRENLK